MAASSEIGMRIRVARERAGLSGSALAELLGYAKPHTIWWRIEAGRRGLSPEQIGILARALRVTTDSLILGTPRRKAPAKRAA